MSFFTFYLLSVYKNIYQSVSSSLLYGSITTSFNNHKSAVSAMIFNQKKNRQWFPNVYSLAGTKELEFHQPDWSDFWISQIFRNLNWTPESPTHSASLKFKDINQAKKDQTPIFQCLAFWQGQKDLNPRHAVLETAALPTELYPYFTILEITSNQLILNLVFYYT